MWNPDELIVAPSTARAGASRAIVRLAGHGLAGLLGRLFVVDDGGWPLPASGPRLVGAVLGDEALVSVYGSIPVGVLVWHGPSGPVGGPLAEVQLPGSVPLVDAVVGRSIELGARLARGGEFSFRAFLAGRLDLLQVEAVLSVVDSQSPDELSAALDRMAGGVGRQLEAVRNAVLDLAGDIEAMIDFGDDLGEEAVRNHERAIAGRLGVSLASLRSVAQQLQARGSAGSERPRVVIAGRPNIGKSSLFNMLLGRNAAIVADEPGTTRDWVEARVQMGGVECVLVDVAGVDAACVAMPHESSHGDASMAAAVRQAAAADVLVACSDAGAAGPEPTIAHPRRIDVVTRCDAAAASPVDRPLPHVSGVIATSVVDGRGIEALRSAIAVRVAEAAGGSSVATLRLAEGAARACEAIGEALAAISEGHGRQPCDEAVVASHVARAVAAIGEVTGRDVGTDILDRIFSRHCIGK